MTLSTIDDKTTSYREQLLAELADKTEAQNYLMVALDEYEQDGDLNSFMLALRNVAEAQGGVGQLAKKTSLNRQHLYRLLSSKGNPRILTLDNILRAMGFKLAVQAA